VSYLQYAARQGDRLIVVITPDSAVVLRKGKAVLFHEKERMELVASLKSVDASILGDTDDSWSILKKIKPAVICFGYDQIKAITALKKSVPFLNIGTPSIMVAPAFKPKKYHSRHFKGKIKK